MKEITSKDNKIYKYCKQLTAKKYRERYGKYIIEGPNLIEEAFKCDVPIEILVMRSGAQSIDVSDFDFSDIVIFSEALFDDISDTVTSQGVLAVVEKNELSLDEFFKKVGERNIVILDRLQDLGNIGTIIRTADAAGYGGLIALTGTGDIYSQKTIRAATGSVFRLPVLFASDVLQVVRLLRENGKRVFASCLDGASCYYDLDLKRDVALIIGNEGRGISDELKALADFRVKIPMSTNIESLNAAVSAGILMYEAMRK